MSYYHYKGLRFNRVCVLCPRGAYMLIQHLAFGLWPQTSPQWCPLIPLIFISPLICTNLVNCVLLVQPFSFLLAFPSAIWKVFVESFQGNEGAFRLLGAAKSISCRCVEYPEAPCPLEGIMFHLIHSVSL